MKRIPIWMVLLAALGLQSVAAHFQWTAWDVLMVPVVYAALQRGAFSGMGAGAAAGLLEDALAGGIFGLHGFSKTLAAYVAHRAARRLMVEYQLVRVMIFTGVFVLEGLTVAALESLLLGTEWCLTGLATRVLLSTLLGIPAFLGLERLDAWTARRSRFG